MVSHESSFTCIFSWGNENDRNIRARANVSAEVAFKFVACRGQSASEKDAKVPDAPIIGNGSFISPVVQDANSAFFF
jgi:hypothetical protein